MKQPLIQPTAKAPLMNFSPETQIKPKQNQFAMFEGLELKTEKTPPKPIKTQPAKEEKSKNSLWDEASDLFDDKPSTTVKKPEEKTIF